MSSHEDHTVACKSSSPETPCSAPYIAPPPKTVRFPHPTRLPIFQWPPYPSPPTNSRLPGIPSLWTGLTASILRQSVYSTARFGLYTSISHKARQFTGQERLSAAWTVACAGLAGGLAGLVGNPTEVVLVRMCADGAKPPAERFAYPNALVGLWRVGRDEGLGTFARGVSANVTRSVLMSESCEWW